MVGELARRASMAGGLVTVRLVADAVNRVRGEPRYTVAVMFSENEAFGFVVIDDARGYPERFKYSQVGAWLAKHLSASDCAVTLEIADASSLGLGFTAARLQKRVEQFAAINVAAIRLAATEKIASVATWTASLRKSAVTAAADNMNKSAVLVDWLRGGLIVPVAEG